MAARSLNVIHIIGTCGRDAETSFTGNQTAVTKFSVACNQSWKDKESGQLKESVDWINVVLWRNEKLGEYLTKGKQVYVQGRLSTRSYDDKNGVKKYVTEVVAEEVILLGGKSEERDERPAAPAMVSGPRAVPSRAAAPVIEDDLGEIPF